ncbi:MAG TPA: hypothetical protein VF085_07485 [Solirubrobacterales bacterium]
MADGQSRPTLTAGRRDTYAEIVKLAEEGVPFALCHSVAPEHYVPACERVPV